MTAAGRRLPYLFVALSVGSLGVCAAAFPLESSFRFVLTSAILLAARRARVVLALELTLGAALFVATWAGAAEWYSAAPYLDTFAHTAVPAVAMAALSWHLARRETPSPPSVFLLAAGLVMLAAVAWELYEWVVVNIFAGRTIHTDVGDTVRDIAASAVGCLLAGLFVRRIDVTARTQA
jgi:hypothetical protein